MPADGRAHALRVGDHPLHELSVLCQQWFCSPYRSIGSGCFCPLSNMPHAHKLYHVRLWQPLGNKEGSWIRKRRASCGTQPRR